MNARKKTYGKRRDRRGAALVEFAIVAPVLFAFVFASVEFSRANMMAHTCQLAAVKAARSGIVPGATAADCENAARAELAIIGIRGAQVAVTPSPLTKNATDVTVAVTAPVAENGYIFSRIFLGRTITSSVTLQREAAVSN